MSKEIFIKLKNGKKLCLPKKEMVMNCFYCFWTLQDLNLEDIDCSDSFSLYYKGMIQLCINLNKLTGKMIKEKMIDLDEVASDLK
jgi:hypothetical protein